MLNELTAILQAALSLRLLASQKTGIINWAAAWLESIKENRIVLA